MDKISIVVPVYFSEDNLLPLYADLKEKVLGRLPAGWDYELVLVDDGSKDRSYQVMCDLKRIDPRIRLVKLARNFGEHEATLAGLTACTGTCAVRKSADLQEPSEMILQMLEKYRGGAPVVIAARRGRDEPAMQKLLSNTYCLLMRKFALKNMPKGGFDSYLIGREVIDVLVKMQEKNTPLTEQILWCGFPMEQVSYIRPKRAIGKSRWTLSKKVKMALDSFLGFSYFPVRFISGVGFVSFLGSCIWLLVLLIQKLAGKITVDGFTTVAILVLLSFGIVMLSIGILGEYIWRMFDATRNRPPYIVERQDEDETDETRKG